MNQEMRELIWELNIPEKCKQYIWASFSKEIVAITDTGWCSEYFKSDDFFPQGNALSYIFTNLINSKVIKKTKEEIARR